jgi:hypothetical protein
MEVAHYIKDILKVLGIPDFQAPPPIPSFIDTSEAIDEFPDCGPSSFALTCYGETRSTPSPMSSNSTSVVMV